MNIDLFAGAGGWATGARGLVDGILGVELDPQAAQTHRQAHGARSVMETDARFVNPHRARAGEWVEGLIASPPCQTFSRAGRQSGVSQVPQLVEAVKLIHAGESLPAAVQQVGLTKADERTLLVLEPIRWIAALDNGGLRLAWVAMEQVPLVLPIYQAYEAVLRERGFSTWTGLLNSWDFGLPQTRERAILAASRLRTVARPYVEVRKPSLAEVLDLSYLPPDAQLKTGSWGAGATRGRPPVRREDPAPTLAFGRDHTGWEWVSDTITGSWPLRFEEMALIQGFPEDYPWQGPKTAVARQISNAIPPPMAREILNAVI